MKSRLLVFAAAIALSASATFAQEKATVQLNGKTVLPTHGSVTGTWFFADTSAENPARSQVLLLGHDKAGIAQVPVWRVFVALEPNETISLDTAPSKAGRVLYRVKWITPVTAAQVEISENDGVITARSKSDLGVTFRLDDFTLGLGDGTSVPLSLDPHRRPQPQVASENLPELAGMTAEMRANALSGTSNSVECFPNLAESLQNELIEWDWRMQDGIETPNEPRTFAQALEKRLPQVRSALYNLLEIADESADNQCAEFAKTLDAIDAAFEASKSASSDEPSETLWRDLHKLRRDIARANPHFPRTPILFAKHVPSTMSHQLTQVYGYCARPGGGLFILENPGQSMTARQIETGLPQGNYMHPTVSYDGQTILFAFCEVPKIPTAWHDPTSIDRHYQIYSIRPDGSELKQLTDGPFDHFAPEFLPDGGVIFCSTRRGGFHRCGSGPCFVYTITKMNIDGTNIEPISYHETQEWNPTLGHDGRIVYTRWDYVDRDAVFYQNLWSMRTDGTDVRIYYGNNTFSPAGIWESKAVPESSKIMAIGGPHHGVSAGSIMLIDNTLGVDGPEPITRLTPEVMYPEAETPLPNIPQLPVVFDFDTETPNFWNGNRPDRPAERIVQTEENSRWPVHCFKSPWPFSEKYFLASYSFDKLLGEAGPNIPNQFGIYWCDLFGTRELLYRDPNIASVWAVPLNSRPMPPQYVSTLPAQKTDAAGNRLSGKFFVQNVYESWPFQMPEGKRIASLRLVQVLPKTTPNANQPMVGAANASPGKQVLGTVPVAEDGSAYFEVPSKTPFLLQALDERGRMVEGMRSLIYAQPGETQSCTGCHENRIAASATTQTLASRQETPSPVTPAPVGAKPLSYPILVQPVLDAKCVACHNDEKTEGAVNLTAAAEGAFTKSYNALIPFVSYSAWGLPEGNHEPMTTPYLFGTPKSRLIEILDAGHYDCTLTDDDWERLCTWIDGANSLFYGTFNPENQKIQQTGGRIDGPDLE